ncbi:Zn-dependent hydrolase [Dendrosporobacter quercicolus]|nr:Zn-dependent hydrolase [Dendrosporobacter quercicolus]
MRMQGIDILAVQAHIKKLAELGQTPDGGTSRLSYSEAWQQAQDFVSGLMQAAGMTVERDAFGNLIGTCRGQNQSLPYLMTGSHLDTVPEGGSLDGALGIIGAIECIRSWRVNGFKPLRTVKIVATVEEEGTLFGVGCLGSRVMAGEMPLEKLVQLKDRSGKTLQQYLSAQQLDIAAAGAARIATEDIHAFLELHVEQGSELDISGQPWAVVTDIVGIDRLWITLQGHANHAGTTRMDRRKDALVAAGRLVQEIYQNALDSQGLYVSTAGTCCVAPGAVNVIPGQVELAVETRASQDAVMERVYQNIISLLQGIEKQYGVKGAITRRSTTPAVSLAPTMIKEFEKAAHKLDMAVCKMPSWAGHDAKIMAGITSCGMLFVPSRNGISHSREEDTRWTDVEKGLQVFCETMQCIASGR